MYSSTAQPSAKRLADVIQSYRPAKSLRNSSPNSVITSLDFDDTGEWLLAACDDESIQLYDCKLGKHSKELFSKKGHKQPVNNLEISPLNDLFLSSSLDNTVRFWDLRSSNCAGCLNIDAPAQIAHDPTGVSFAVASHHHSHLFLYDIRMFDKEPFAMFPILDDEYLKQFSYPPMMPEWTKVEFSNDGRLIMIGTNAKVHYIVDSFKGEIKCRLQRKGPTPVGRDGKWDMLKASGDVCFSPDAGFVVGGQDKGLAMWDLSMRKLDKDRNLMPFMELESPKGPASVVAFNPRNHIFATAHKEVSFWLPDQHVSLPSPSRD
ncbi:member of Set1p complex, histone methyl transferase [Orbilia oligospora]|uniref:Member of Set1p complex, histone methyl transferase n=1 Tax=Orbilia oligospora TaxID=2813651 RepID=A0A7C8QQY8_ORBOL|nr:member of Set1p complex, histone methyl transferase [Orbilia oligospora]